MKLRTLALPGWIEEERVFLVYLMSPHDGHAYPEDVLDGISLITGWVLALVSVLCVIGVIIEAFVR